MAYRKRTTTRRKSTYTRRKTRKAPARRRAAAPRQQVVRIVLEQAAPSLVNDPAVISAREVKPKKAKF